MMSIENTAEQILLLLGSSDNVVSITHCATRLRPTLKDRSLVKSKDIEKLEGVIGVVDKDAGFQIIIGTNVGDAYNAFLQVWNPQNGTSQEGTIADAKTEKAGAHLLNAFVAFVVSIFSPLLPLLAGSGLLRGFTILANELGLLSTKSTTNLVLTLAATSVFYFLPLLVAVTAAKRFNTSPYIAIAVLGALIMPGFINLIQENGGNMVSFFGLSIPVFNYTSQIIPAILTTWIQSKMEHFMKKKLPNSLHMIVIPTILLLILVPIAAGVVGPLGNYLSIGLANVVNALTNINKVVTGAIIGGIWNILIMFGVHWAPNTMVVIPEIAKTGHSALIAYAANANFGMAGAALAIFIRSRNKKLKSFSLTAITSVLLSGIVEPAIYGLGVKFKSPLVAGCLGAAVGGAFMGAFNVVGSAFVFGGVTTIPAFAGSTLWAYITGLTISFIGGLAFTLLFGVKSPEAEMASLKK